MQAIILAAGFGKRLRPLTDVKPKSLVEVNGTPLLVNALNQLGKLGDIDEVIIVVGHMKDKIVARIGHQYEGIKITYVENPDYQTTNNIYSFYLAKPYIKSDVLMLECDLFYQYDLVQKIHNQTADCNILVSKYNPITMNGTVVRVDAELNVSELVVKSRQGRDFDYTSMMKTVNVYRFSRQFITEKFLPMVEHMVMRHDVNSYYELALGVLLYLGNIDVKAVVIDEERWSEIDDAGDLQLAEEKFQCI